MLIGYLAGEVFFILPGWNGEVQGFVVSVHG
jgi:hypothetical protein